MFNPIISILRFCPSMFLYLMAVIPCDWLAKNEVIKCINEATNAKTLCNRAVNGSGDTLKGVSYVLHVLDYDQFLLLLFGLSRKLKTSVKEK